MARGAAIGLTFGLAAPALAAADATIAVPVARAGGVTAKIIGGIEKAGSSMEGRTQAVSEVIKSRPGQKVLMNIATDGTRVLSGGAGQNHRVITLYPDGRSVVQAWDVASKSFKVVADVTAEGAK